LGTVGGRGVCEDLLYNIKRGGCAARRGSPVRPTRGGCRQAVVLCLGVCMCLRINLFAAFRSGYRFTRPLQ